LICKEHEEREHESDDDVEVIDADSIGDDEEVSDYGGDPEDAEATILVLEDRHCRVVYTPYKGTVNRVRGRVCTGPGLCQRCMPGPHWTLRSNPSKRAPPGPYQSLPPSRAGGEPDGKQGTLLSAVEYLGTRKARRVANLAYAAELAKTSPQVELGFGDDERAEEEEILFERESTLSVDASLSRVGGWCSCTTSYS
jgi:hypothetical protein